MTKKHAEIAVAKPSDLDQRLASHQILEAQHFAETSMHDVELAKVNEIAKLLWVPKDIEPQELHARLVLAIDMYEGIKPQDSAEAMMATQMVGSHNAAMECLRRAAIPGQSFEVVDKNLKQAERMMRLHAQQFDTLDKRRSRGHQKIVVERVHVASGGQAIVGSVQAGPNLSGPDPLAP